MNKLTRGLSRTIRCAEAAGSASPMARTTRSDSGNRPAASASNRDGTVCRTDTFSRAICATSAPGSSRPSRAAITRRPPHSTADQNSHTDRSKVAAVLSRTASSGVSAKVSRFQSNWLTIAPWLTATPLGTPVDPEVKMM